MSNYQSNSYRDKEANKAANSEEQRPKVNSVVTSKVTVTKKSEFSKIKDQLIPGGNGNLFSYIFLDVLLPVAKDAIYDIVTNGIETASSMLLFGSTDVKRRKTTLDRISYGSCYGSNSKPNRLTPPRDTISRADKYDFDKIVIGSRGDAEAVLMHLDDMIERYGSVSVADFYDLCGKTGEYTDNRYGWTSLQTAEVQRTRDGYILSLPRALPMN